jgi:hypothetical protein
VADDRLDLAAQAAGSRRRRRWQLALDPARAAVTPAWSIATRIVGTVARGPPNRDKWGLLRNAVSGGERA